MKKKNPPCGPTLIVSVGISGSGKSYLGKQLMEKNDNCVMLDSDDLREELFGDRYDQTHNQQLFEEMAKHTIDNLRQNHTVYYCATNVSYKKRKHLIDVVKKEIPDANCICWLINTTIEECKRRNNLRDHPVPDEIINKQARSLHMPLDSEGWDSIQVVRGEEWNLAKANAFYTALWQTIDGFGVKGAHHNFRLQEHLTRAAAIAHRDSPRYLPIEHATLWHDVGKPFTLVYDDEGEPHFYGHENVGAIYALNYFNSLWIAQLICYHMKPYTGQHERRIWRDRCGKKIWNALKILHEGDMKAH